jgi:hypothetical protein
MWKTCIKCGYEGDSFRKERICISCQRKRSRKWREDNLEKALEITRKWREDNPEQIKKTSKKWRENNLEKARESNRKWYKDNVEKVKETNRKWHKDNHEKAIENGRKWYKDNAKKVKETNKKWRENNPNYQKKRYKNDIQHRLAMIHRCIIKAALKSQKVKKSNKSMQLLGCSIEYYKKYIEQQFTSTMSWENQGAVWHIDHYTPLSFFDLTNPEEQLKAFHYMNCRPLEAAKNLSKGDKIEVLTSEGIFWV